MIELRPGTVTLKLIIFVFILPNNDYRTDNISVSKSLSFTTEIIKRVTSTSTVSSSKKSDGLYGLQFWSTAALSFIEETVMMPWLRFLYLLLWNKCWIYTNWIPCSIVDSCRITVMVIGTYIYSIFYLCYSIVLYTIILYYNTILL